jgi:outer membrane protein
LAEIELAAAKAEIALRRVDLINARNTLATTRLRLLQLLNPPGKDLWDREIILREKPVVPDVILDEVESHVEVALSFRPDLNQARLGVQRGDLEIMKTKNGLLPVMDLFITLGKTGYADSFGRSVSDLDEDSYDISGGITLAYPLFNRDARARHQRATLSRGQSMEAVENLAQLVEVDVRTAYIEVRRTEEQVSATAAARRLQEEKLRAEREKFRVGRSTTLLVAAAQRDLVTSQISEIQAVVDYLKALVELHRLDGSLLERLGISAPGRKPVDLSVPQWK